MNIKNAILGLGLAVSLTGCLEDPGQDKKNQELLDKNGALLDKANERIYGTVLEENVGNWLEKVPGYSGVVSYSNETVKINSTYALKMQVEDSSQEIVVNVLNSGNEGQNIALETLLEEGDRISIRKGNLFVKFIGESYEKVYSSDYTDYITEKTQVADKYVWEIKKEPSQE